MPTCTRVAHDDPAILALTREVVQEYAVRYDDPDGDIAPTAPDAVWVLVRDADGTPVACGAVQPWSHTVAGSPSSVGEVKRMYVVPAARGRGLARAVLDELVAVAREQGLAALVLETGTEQPEAIGLYSSYGFAPMAVFGPYADDPRSRCFRLELA
ncbi:MAG TPA: GNAT family N-acetyltransferase [Candidatus Nanopelagicales bacterium]|nr:GNAT family N-acetyltransferase [Candidatus Nanopelagicales bacterium]